MGLEALWQTESGVFNPDVRENWRYTAMIMQPDIITPEVFEEGRTQLLKKHPGPGPQRLRLETFHEGPAIQVMHIGPYATEMTTIARMDEFAQGNGLTLHNRHRHLGCRQPPRVLRETPRNQGDQNQWCCRNSQQQIEPKVDLQTVRSQEYH